jgi:hypothetical protein
MKGSPLVLFAASLPLLAQGPACDIVPGWTQAGPARSYLADTLYDYMDGNSEGYLIYGFQQMRGVNCKSGDVQFVIDVSDMNDAESAWGLFASNRDPRLPVESIGVTGQVAPQRGIFVKGNRFIEISATPASVDHSAAIRTFLKAMDAKLDGTTSPPPPVGWFPKESLDAGSIRLIPQSLLGISMLKKGYLALYDYGRAFVLRQADAATATQTMAKLRQRFGDTQPSTICDESFQANDRYLGHLLFFRKGATIAGFANLKEGVDPMKPAQALAAQVP